MPGSLIATRRYRRRAWSTAASTCGSGTTASCGAGGAATTRSTSPTTTTTGAGRSRDERELFEKLTLDGAQAGLAWITILRKREGYRQAFEGFDPERRSPPTATTTSPACSADPGIVRNRQKVAAAIGNARALLAMHDDGETLSELVWSHAPPPRRRRSLRTEIQVTTPEAEALSKALRSRGWRFVGPTIVYAFMQAVGVVDDHLKGCHRAG